MLTFSAIVFRLLPPADRCSHPWKMGSSRGYRVLAHMGRPAGSRAPCGFGGRTVQDSEVGLLLGREERACASPALAQSCPGHGLCLSRGLSSQSLLGSSRGSVLLWVLSPQHPPCPDSGAAPGLALGPQFLSNCIDIKPFPHITEQVSSSWGTLTHCSTTSLHSDPIGLELASAPAAGGLRPQDPRPQRPRTGSVVPCASDQ